MTGSSDPDQDRPPAGPSVDNWDPETYDGAHSYVYEYGTDLVGLLDPDHGDRVLDLGCGTGHITDALRREGARTVGVDRERSMIRTAATTYPDCRFVRADVRSIPFDGAFDGVLSNAVLHWVPATDQDGVLDEVSRALVPGGTFVAEMGGVGNLDAIVEAVETAMHRHGYSTSHPWYFPSVGEYATRLETAGFEVRYATLFDRPTELDGGREGLSKWLDAFGDGLFAGLSDDERRTVIREAESLLEAGRFRGGSWVADYRRLRFVATVVEWLRPRTNSYPGERREGSYASR